MNSIVVTTEERLSEIITQVVEKALFLNEKRKQSSVSKAEACRMLGNIHFNTLNKYLQLEGIENITLSEIEKTRGKYPKFRK